MQHSPDWVSVEDEASAEQRGALLGHPGLEQQVVVAGWWVLLGDLAGLEASGAPTLLVIAV